MTGVTHEMRGRVRTPPLCDHLWHFSVVIWTHLFVWYLESILRASNAILRVTEQAHSMEGWSEIEWYQYICCLLCTEENIFLHLISLPLLLCCCREWCLSWGAPSNVNFWFLPWLPLLCGYPGAPRLHYYISGDITQPVTCISLNVKRKKLGSGNFYEKD